MDEKKNTDATRINKLISDYGFCSRREADKLIADGRVTINNRTAQPGDRVGEDDKVRIDGDPLYFVPLENRPKKHRWGPPKGAPEQPDDQPARRAGSRGASRHSATHKTPAGAATRTTKSQSKATGPARPARPQLQPRKNNKRK